MKKEFGILLLLISLVMPSVTIIKSIQFDQRCKGYLMQASEANSVELTIERLDKAIAYIEENNLTHGYTSILWKTEDDNIGFWYQNIKTCRTELENCLNSNQLEKTNVLLKVRESLIRNTEDGARIIIPNGISRYPHNMIMGILNFLSCLLFMFSIWYIDENRW